MSNRRELFVRERERECVLACEGVQNKTPNRIGSELNVFQKL